MIDEIKLKSVNGESFDKKQIALAIRNANYDDELACSLLREQILEDCSECKLKKICENIDGVARDLKERTTKVVKTFTI